MPTDGVLQIDLPLDDVSPCWRKRVLEIGHEDLRAGIQRVDHHLPVRRTRDLDAAVIQIQGGGRDLPRRAADQGGVGQVNGETTSPDLALPDLAQLEQLAAPRVELIVKARDELERRRRQYTLRARNIDLLSDR